jgi:RecA/RadA recombinase
MSPIRVQSARKVALSPKKAAAPVAAPAIKKKTTLVEEAKPFDARAGLQAVYNKQLDSLEKEYNMTSGEVDIPDKLSTNNLMYDLLTTGGIMAGGFYQWSGPEGGGKSSGSLQTLGMAINAGIGMLGFHDIENAVKDRKHVAALMRHDPNDVFFGEGRKARLYHKSVLENFFIYSRAMMRACPDKIYRAETDQWYFVFDADKDGKALREIYKDVIGKHNADLYSLTGRIWCPTDLRGLQGLIICDSFASLITKNIDEKDTGGGMSADARAFSESLKKVKGIMVDKAFAIIGTNQVREKPGQNFGHGGPSYYEPGGNALKHNADNRIQQFPRSVPDKLGYKKGVAEHGFETGTFGEEFSFYGDGLDRYKYVILKNTKNKFGTPHLEGWIRFLIRDGDGRSRGICPVMDTKEYLRRTGRIENVRAKGMSGAFKVNVGPLADEIFDMKRFKGLILALTDPKIAPAIKRELFGGQKLPDIRKMAFAEIQNGKAYTKLQQSSKKKDDDEDLEAE